MPLDSLLSDYFERRLTGEDLRLCAVAALRSLLADQPNRPEEVWATKGLFLGYPEGQWFEISSAVGLRYMQVGRNGRFSRDRPAGVGDSQLVKVTKPPGPFFGIRTFLDRMAGRFEDMHDLEFGNLLRELSPALRAMGDGSFDAMEVRGFLKGCYGQLSSGQSAVPFVERYMAELLPRHSGFRIPGYYVAYMLVLDGAWRAMRERPVVDLMLASFNRPGQAIQDKIGNVNDLLLLVLKTLAGPAGEAQAAERAIKSMHAVGEQLVRDARSAESVGVFYGKIYESCPWLYGAFRGYQFLANTTADPEKRREHGAAATFCEELSVRTRTSLDHIFGTWVGTGSLEGMRREIAHVRRKDGDFDAEMLADQRINSELLFPPFWRPYLLGQVDAVPARPT
jgi:hypothetical protein